MSRPEYQLPPEFVNSFTYFILPVFFSSTTTKKPRNTLNGNNPHHNYLFMNYLAKINKDFFN